jgi:hypothetical protein
MAFPIDQDSIGFEVLSRLKKIFGDRAFAHQMPAVNDPLGLGRYQIGWRSLENTYEHHTWYGDSWTDAWDAFTKAPPEISGPWLNCSGNPFVDDAVEQKPGFAVVAAPSLKLWDNQQKAIEAANEKYKGYKVKFKVGEALTETISINAAKLQHQPDPSVFDTVTSSATDEPIKWLPSIEPGKVVLNKAWVKWKGKQDDKNNEYTPYTTYKHPETTQSGFNAGQVISQSWQVKYRSAAFELLKLQAMNAPKNVIAPYHESFEYIAAEIKSYGEQAQVNVLPLLDNIYAAAQADYQHWVKVHQGASGYGGAIGGAIV